MNNYIAASSADFAQKVWSALTSSTALIIYAAIILILILVLAVKLIVGEQKRVSEIKQREEDSKNVDDSALAGVKTAIEQLENKVNCVSAAAIPVATTTSAPIITSALNKNKEEKEEGSGSRFYMLTEIDREYESYKRPEYDEEITLKELCEEFRNYSAGELKLYYDIEDIRRFIGALAVTKLIILQGMSGTGKTSLAYAFGEFLDNKTVVVPIQPMWKERTDLVGYYNEFTKKFNETTLLYKMYEANNNSAK